MSYADSVTGETDQEPSLLQAMFSSTFTFKICDNGMIFPSYRFLAFRYGLAPKQVAVSRKTELMSW